MPKTVQPKTKTWTRAILLGLAAIVAIAVFSYLPSTTVDAGQCPDGTYSTVGEAWVSTPAAVSRTLAGDCPAGYACKEWCITGCGQTQAKGVFNCFVE